VFEVELADQMWFDGLSRLVKIRSCSVDKAVTFLTSACCNGEERARDLVCEVFAPILQGEDGFLRRFVKPVECSDVVAAISFVKPWDKTKFLTHLCLSMGSYDTEADLFLCSGMKQAFFKAGLLPSASEASRDDVLDILRKYVLTDLRFHPISSPQFGRYLKAANDTLQQVLVDDVIGDYTPVFSNVVLKDQASDELKEKENMRRTNLISALNDDDAIRSLIPDYLDQATIDR
jgi:hypothetical protein